MRILIAFVLFFSLTAYKASASEIKTPSPATPSLLQDFDFEALDNPEKYDITYISSIGTPQGELPETPSEQIIVSLDEIKTFFKRKAITDILAARLIARDENALRLAKAELAKRDDMKNIPWQFKIVKQLIPEQKKLNKKAFYHLEVVGASPKKQP